MLAEFGDVAMPMTEHSAQILAGTWPSQLVTTWSGYAAQYSRAAETLLAQVQVQHTLQEILGPMSGAFIESARTLVSGRRIVLENRVAAYRFAAGKAQWAANEIHATKSDLIEIVNKAEEEITAARERAEKLKAAPYMAGRAAAIEAMLQAEITKIVSTSRTEAEARDMEAATTVAAYTTDLKSWVQPYTNRTLPTSGELGINPESPPPDPPHQPETPTRAVDFSRVPSMADADRSAIGSDETGRDPAVERSPNVEQSAWREPTKVEASDTPAKSAPKHSHTPSMPSPSSAAPSSGGASSGGGSSGSVFGQLMSPLSSSSSPSSALSPSSTGATPGASSPAASAGTGVGAGPNPAMSPTVGGNAGLNPALSAVGTSSGIAEASARMTSGAVSATTHAVSGAVNAGTQAAQTAATAASAPTPPPASGPPPVNSAMPMVAPPPAPPGGPGPVTSGPPPGAPASPNVGGGPPASAPAAAGQTQLAGVAGPAGTPAGAAAAPLFLTGSPVAALRADGLDWDQMVDRALDIGQAVVTTLLAQTRAAGYPGIDWALSLVWERSGQASAWLATSEGPSYIPLGVAIPKDIGVAVADPIVGRDLWDKTTAAGGANVLEVLVQHVRQRDAALPGARMLALASSVPLGRVTDWASMVGARAVSVDAAKVEPATSADLGGTLLHRCAVAMPWEWHQANAFTAPERLQVAARHMRMAAVSGHLAGQACEQVMRLFEQHAEIDDDLWARVQAERIEAMVAYQMADQMRGQGGGVDPAQAFRTARAAEVVGCLRDYDTVEGCADLLYASRLAGAPLNPAVAVR